jgi:caa(3)-type oxidase subunit IV
MAHEHGSKKQTWIIWGYLLLLTVLEVGIVYVPGIGKTYLVSALVVMALAKAILVGFYYMHLKYETTVLKLTVAIPMATPALYAFVLIAEGAARYLL